MNKKLLLLALSLSMAATACSSDGSTEASDDQTETVGSSNEATPNTVTVDVWADNWFALTVNGELVGEDSISIDTERSFNKETFSFEATYPMTIALEAKDFKENDTGLEYIGDSNQQMGDGGVIAQFKDSNGNVIAVTDTSWKSLVIHEAPLDKSCEKSENPDQDCDYEISNEPESWKEVAFDDSSWQPATEHSESDVDPKQGYDEVSWDGSAKLIWGSDLETNNTVLLRTTIAS